MAGKKPKTPWGKAYSGKFKELKLAWDKSKKVGGTVVRTWKSAFKAIGSIARKHADSKHSNPVAAGKSRKGPKRPKVKAKKPGKKVPGRIFSALSAAVRPRVKPAPASSATVHLEKVRLAGGELVNTGDAAQLRKDGSREVVSGGTWAPTARTIGKARKLREQLAGQGVRFSRLTVLVDGKRQDRKRKGRARFVDGKLYLE